MEHESHRAADDAARPAPRPRLLGGRDARLLISAYALSCVGDYLAAVALTIRVHDLTGSGWAVSAVLLAGLAPVVLLAPVAGLVVDRFETVGVLRAVALGEAAIAGSLAFVGDLPTLLGLALLLGSGFAITHPGLFALVPEVAGEEHVARVNGYFELARWGGATAGPLLAGALAASVGTGVALFVDAATFLLMAGAASRLSLRRPPVLQPVSASRTGRAPEGLMVLARDPVLRLVVGVLAAMVLTSSGANVIEVFFAKDVLHAGDGGYGAIVAVWGAGVVVAVALLTRHIPAHRLALTVLVAAVGVNLAYVMAAATAGLLSTEVAFFMGGVANGVGLVAMRTLLHQRSVSSARGRVFAAYGGLVTAAQLAALGLGGLLVEAVGPQVALLVAGLAGSAVAGGGLVAYRLSARTATLALERSPALHPRVAARGRP